MSETFIALAYQYGAICLPRSFEILGIGKDLVGRLIHSGRGISVAVPSASRRAVRSPLVAKATRTRQLSGTELFSLEAFSI